MNRLRTDKKNTTATPDSLRIPYGGELALSAETRECLGIQGVALGFIDTVPSEEFVTHAERCLLYTSDAADERSSVDLGGRRIIKKKKRIDQGDYT